MNLSEEEKLLGRANQEPDIDAIREKLRQQQERSASYREQQRKQREAEEKAEAERKRLEEEQKKLRRYRDMQNYSIWYFMKEASCIRFDPKERTPSAVLYEAYCRWCEGQNLFPESIRVFCLDLRKNAQEYRIAPTNFIWQGRHIRGYRGLLVTEEKHGLYTTHA